MANGTLCGTCNLEKDNIRNISPSSASGQWRCDDCSRVLSRVRRMQTSGALASEYHDLTKEQKEQFMQTAMDLFGDDINKAIHDVYECTTTNTDTYNARRSDEYLEYDDAEKKYKDRPDVWEHILDNADQFTCDVTSITYIGIPRYSALHDHSHKKEETRKRTIQSDRLVKAGKKPRVIKAPGAKGEGKGGKGEKMITLSERQTKDRDTTEQKITEACVELEATIMHANAPEIKSEIPPKFLASATGMANGFKEVIQAVGAFKEEQVASKRFSEWLKKAKEAVKTCNAINEKLTTYVQDAQNICDEEEE